MLRAVMVIAEPPDEPPLDVSDETAVHRMTDEEIAEVDETIIKCASYEWAKTAKVVTSAMTKSQAKFGDIPEQFYGARVRALVSTGRLMAAGDLNRMQSSDVRLVPRDELRKGSAPWWVTAPLIATIICAFLERFTTLNYGWWLVLGSLLGAAPMYIWEKRLSRTEGNMPGSIKHSAPERKPEDQ